MEHLKYFGGDLVFTIEKEIEDKLQFLDIHLKKISEKVVPKKKLKAILNLGSADTNTC